MLSKLLVTAALLATVAAPASAAGFTYVGPRGGMASVSARCSDGVAPRCKRDWTYTNPSGAMWSGEGAVALGPYRGFAWRTVTTPAGETYYRAGVWRR